METPKMTTPTTISVTPPRYLMGLLPLILSRVWPPSGQTSKKGSNLILRRTRRVSYCSVYVCLIDQCMQERAHERVCESETEKKDIY